MKKNLTIKETFDLAFEHHKKNDFKIAENLYKDVLKLNPNHFETIYLLGSLLLQKKDFNNYFEIIENFNEVYPNFMYELHFEKLVNNPEEESKKLMKFCGLPWDKKCLEFYKRKDLISKTTSNVQIRKAIYKHQSEKYLPYKNFLNK